MTSLTVPRRLLFAALSLVAIAALTACSTPSLPGQLGHLQRVASTCPTGSTKLASFIAVDGSDAVSDQKLASQRLAVIDQVTERTLLCGGHLQVVGFSTTSAANATIYDAELPTLQGATVTARVRQAGPVLKRVEDAISKAYLPTLTSLPTTATDVVGELRLAGEYQPALGSGYELNAWLLTDGLQNVGVNLYSPLTPAQAQATANQIEVPDLQGATVTVAGLGAVYDPPVSSAVANSLVAFYTDLLARTHAAHVVAVTTFPTGA